MLHALEAAHALGVIHRDLKPGERVPHVARGAHRVLKLIDFGIAKLRSPGTKNMTAAGVLMGTAEYMAPEQVHAASDVDGRSDLYCGSVCSSSRCSPGRRPVAGGERGHHRAQGGTRRRDLAATRRRAAGARADRGAGAHGDGGQPENRFASATEMRLALEAARDAAGNARPGRPTGALGALGAPGRPSALRSPQASMGQASMGQANLGTGTELGAPLPPEVRAAMGAPYTSMHAMNPALGTTTPAGP